MKTFILLCVALAVSSSPIQPYYGAPAEQPYGQMVHQMDRLEQPTTTPCPKRHLRPLLAPVRITFGEAETRPHTHGPLAPIPGVREHDVIRVRSGSSMLSPSHVNMAKFMAHQFATSGDITVRKDLVAPHRMMSPVEHMKVQPAVNVVSDILVPTAMSQSKGYYSEVIRTPTTYAPYYAPPTTTTQAPPPAAPPSTTYAPPVYSPSTTPMDRHVPAYPYSGHAQGQIESAEQASIELAKAHQSAVAQLMASHESHHAAVSQERNSEQTQAIRGLVNLHAAAVQELSDSHRRAHLDVPPVPVTPMRASSVTPGRPDVVSTVIATDPAEVREEVMKHHIPILHFSEEIHEGHSHSVSFDAANGIEQRDTTSIDHVPGGPGECDKAVITKTGSYSYITPEGHRIQMSYVADKNGFHAKGDHLPTPPPIPIGIQKGLEELRRKGKL